MKFSFKKISAIGSSLLLAGMSVALPVAAANYPAPFVVGGSADVAVVYGTGSGVSTLDLIQAGNIQTNLQSSMGASSTGTSASVSGEAYALFTSSNKLYMNSSLNAVKSTLTDTQLPTVLADSDFEGDASRDVTQKIVLNSNPRIQFGNYPTSDTDPSVAISLGTTVGNYIYNATVNFNGAVNFTHTDSIGETLDIFGQTYTVGAGSTSSNLYLYKSSETVSLSIGGTDPSSQTVTVDNATYTVELVSASDTAATIKVIDSSGNAESKEITEDNSKKVQGIDVAVNLADEDTATNRLIAEITVGADKLKLTDDSEVRVGSNEDLIDGTQVNILGTGTDWTNCTGLTIQVFAEDTDLDAILEGESFTDPVFGSFKIDFSGMNIGEESTARETIEVQNSGDDKATVKFTTHTGDENLITWYYNSSAATTAELGDSTGDDFNVVEMAEVNKSEYVVVGNEENGYLLEMKSISNSTATATDDYVEFKDVMSGKTYKSDTASTEGTVSLSVEGEEYTVTYHDVKTVEGDEYVRIDYPDTNDDGYVVLYPTIETSKGANLGFYAPQTINLTDYDGSDTDVSRLYFPDGDGYSYITLTISNGSVGNCNWTIEGTTATVSNTTFNSSSSTDSIDITIGRLTYNMTANGTDNQTIIYLEDVDENAITLPGIVLFEEQDDSSNKHYNALIVKMEGSGTSAASDGVLDVEATWGADAEWDNKQLNSDTDIYKDMDYYGTIVTTDRSESDQYTAVISYPDEQVYAQVYVAEEDASITAAGTSGTTSVTQLGDVLVKDSEVSSVNSKNLIIVGGSCINSAAATVLGGAYCGAGFTEATGVGSGEFMIKSVSDAYTSGKIALVVAGYDAADTVNAATYLRTQAVDTSKEYKGTSSTSATLVTTTA